MIYLDNSATTRPTEEVIEKVAQAMREDFGNPSSLHKKGIDAEKFIREAKKTIAGSLKVREGNIVFTSGGTESNNYSIIGSALAYQRTGKHIVTTEIEHPSVSAVTDYLVQQGFEVTYLKPDKTGKITIDELKNAIRPDTILVSIMTVNNEIGTIQDIEELAKTAKEINPEIRFHTDAVQAYAKTELKPGKWGVDLMSVSAHKFHGPKGVGFIYIADGGKIHPYMHGGGQQKNRRSGTENVPGIAGMSVAVNQAAKDIRDNTKKTSELKRSFLESLKDLDDIIIQGVSEEFGSGRHITPEEIEKATDAELYLPYIISIGIKDIRSEVLLHALEDADIFISSGSACSSNHPGTSRTLTAIGSPKEYLDSTIRLSLSRFTTTEEMEHTSEKLHELIPALRRFTRR